ncbi:MAG: DUF779 domain-containing protein [Pseudomonadota bacterium]
MTDCARSERVTATPAALDFLDELRAAHGAVVFHQPGTSFDGFSPICSLQDDYLVDDNDVLLGFVDGSPFYVGADQYPIWAHTQFVIDAVPGGGGIFSLDSGTGRRFLTRSRVLPPEEMTVGPVS